MQLAFGGNTLSLWLVESPIIGSILVPCIFPSDMEVIRSIRS